MAKSLPPLTWFRSFEAAARHLSFTAAAYEIGLTQSAVSQQIKALESRLGAALFLRKARALSLTDEGRKLLPQVEAALAQLSAATAHFDAAPARDLLTIAASVSVTQWLIAPALPSFTAAHPGVRIRFLSAIWPDDFKTALADVEIRFGSRKQVGDDAVALEPSGLVAVKSVDLAGDLRDLPLIGSVGTSDTWSTWALAAGYPPLTPSIHADSYGMALHLAAQGNGVALVNAMLALHATRSGALGLAHPLRIPAHEGYFLSVPGTKPAAARFRDWLLSQLDDTVPA
jgi:DNA-binding transcriptional LysR family regulator